LSNYIKNPIRLKRIEAGLNQQRLAKLLGVMQGYISRIESRNYQVTNALMERMKSALTKKGNKSQKKVKARFKLSS
jgi:predicted transcriptional regulator